MGSTDWNVLPKGLVQLMLENDVLTFSMSIPLEPVAYVPGIPQRRSAVTRSRRLDDGVHRPWRLYYAFERLAAEAGLEVFHAD